MKQLVFDQEPRTVLWEENNLENGLDLKLKAAGQKV